MRRINDLGLQYDGNQKNFGKNGYDYDEIEGRVLPPLPGNSCDQKRFTSERCLEDNTFPVVTPRPNEKDAAKVVA